MIVHSAVMVVHSKIMEERGGGGRLRLLNSRRGRVIVLTVWRDLGEVGLGMVIDKIRDLEKIK